ncbi:MAG: hypothetical protein AB8B73_09020 [Ekhidna sp.]
MRLEILFMTLSFLMLGCSSKETHKKPADKYSHDIGDILFNPDLDNPNFKICDSTNISTSRRGLIYLGGNGSVENAIKQSFVFEPSFQSFNGFITIRFIVNCELESDRFRAESMDYYFVEKDCPKELENHLLQITRGLDEWTYSSPKHEVLDHAKYLNFKIKEGRIENVLQ